MRRRHATYFGANSAAKTSPDFHAVAATLSTPSDVAATKTYVAPNPFPTTGGSSTTSYSNHVHVPLDVSASALSVDATGSVAVLAGRQGLHLVNLETPFLPPATLPHQTKLDVPVVKCNPHALCQSHVASSSHRNALIWDIAGLGACGKAPTNDMSGRPLTSSLVTTLRAHTRPISDLAWSPMEPSVLATCSADAKTLLWDLRSPQRPVQTLHTFNARVLQVAWNQVDATSVATAHDGEVRVWDLRAAAERAVAPAALIPAHLQTIYGLEWHPHRKNEFVTCSEDKTVKFWNVSQPRVCQGTVSTGAPVWRAQYTPFGDALVTISQRMDTTLRLWALSRGPIMNELVDVSSATAAAVSAELVHTYVGHEDLIKAMAWRARPSSGVYQLVTWSKDQTLHLWHVDLPQLEACGYDTTSYVADAATFDARRLTRAELVDMHAQHSNYSFAALKSDLMPLVVPKAAVPLRPEEYTLEGKERAIQACLALEHELLSETPSRPEPSVDNDPKATQDQEAARSKRAANAGTARALPCPRISGAAFSGPNRLLVFDSRVAIGQFRRATVPTGPASTEHPPRATLLPRTYDELLDLRDSRFATKKTNTQSVNLLASSTLLDDATEWTRAQAQDTSELEGYDHELERADSAYVSTCVARTELEPSRAVAGLQLSPRFPASERLQRVDSATPAWHLDLSVTILDLSQLCGVSSILTYKTELLPRAPAASVTRPHGHRSMVSWMLRAAENLPGKRQPHHLTHVYQRLGTERGARDDPMALIAATCARNAHVAQLAGRRDLRQIWSLLELSTAPAMHFPLYMKPSPATLRTSSPWSAHPLGKRLVRKILDMYENVGDVHALASIVCALQPAECPQSKETRVSVMAMDEQLPVVREDLRSGDDMEAANLAGTLRPRWSASTTLPHVGANLTEPSEAPPLVRGTRRSSSHAEGRGQGLGLDKDAAFRTPRDWPIASSGTNSAASSRQSSPAGERPLSTSFGLHRSHRDGAYKAFTATHGSGWKMDADTTFKTWSGNSTKEAPPPRLTAETFQSPIEAVNGKSPVPPLVVSASPRIGPMVTSPLPATALTISREEEVDPTDRIVVHLSSRSIADESGLLSSHPEDEARYDAYKEAYADVLYRYGAMTLRNEVLKTKSHGTHEARGISMGLFCGSCHARTIDLVCTSCRDFAVRCSVCQLVVRGQSMFCMTCGHGGHAAHVREWFELETACPTGCGCWCKQATATMPAAPPQDHNDAEQAVVPSRSHSF